MVKVEIQHRQTGDPSSGDGANVEKTELELVEEKISAEELIRRSVRARLRELVRTEQLQQPKFTSQFFLTEADIEVLAKRGKIALAETSDQTTNVDPEEFANRAEQRAVEAFGRGLFTMLIGGRQVESLNESLSFAEQTSVIFLRLVPLVGG